MGPVRLSLGVLLTGCLQPASAHAVTTVVKAPPEIAAQVAARLLVEQVDPEGHVSRSALEVDIPGAVEVPWSGDESLTLSVAADGFWSETVSLPRGTPPQPVELRVFPLSRLRGSLSIDDGPESPPGHVVLRFTPADKAVVEELREPEHVVANCPALGAKFDCGVPAGRWHIGLFAEGFAPVYWWDRQLAVASAQDLGEIDLAHGATVIGRVVVGGDGAPYLLDPPARVALVPRPGPAWAEPEAGARTDQRERVAQTSPTGLFTLTGVLPGSYSLNASADDHVGASLYLLVPEGVSETRLASDLVLQRAIEILEVRVRPASDPRSGTWTVEVTPWEQLVGRGPVATAPRGVAMFSNINPAKYVLRLYDSKGSKWLTEEHTVDSVDTLIELEVRSLRIAGELFLGEEPTQGALEFRSTALDRIVLLKTARDGHFEGALPTVAEWRLHVSLPGHGTSMELPEPIAIEPDALGSAHLEIRLPAGVVWGDVQGATQHGARAQVILRDSKGRLVVQGAATEDGTFRLVGVPPGDYQISARTRTTAAQAQRLGLREHEEVGPVRLLLEPMEEVTGRVETDGREVVDAVIVTVGRHGNQRAQTGADGSFTLRPGGVPEALLLTAPGLATKIVPWQPDMSIGDLDLSMSSVGGSLTLNLAELLPRIVGGTSSAGTLVFEVEGARVKHQDLFRYAETFDQAEELTLPNLEPGPYRVCVDMPGFQDCQAGQVVAGDDLLLEFGVSSQGGGE